MGIVRFYLALMTMTTLAENMATFACKQMVPALFILGDSLVDTGNNNYLPLSIVRANFPHHGLDFPTHSATGRFCNGFNAADAISKRLDVPFPPAYLSIPPGNTSMFMSGVNFASAGAGIFNNTDQALAQSIPFSRQMKYFETVYQALVDSKGEMRTRQLMSKSLFLIVFGSNDLFDYVNYIDIQGIYSPEEYTDLMESNMERQVTKLYEMGATMFSFVGVGKIGCAPARRIVSITGQCEDAANSVAQMYNDKLVPMLARLNSHFDGFRYSYFDAYTVMEDIFAKPSKYGFEVVNEACCGSGRYRAEIPCSPISLCCPNRTDHMFWDLYHPSQAMYSHLADAIFDGPPTISFPVNVRRLVSGRR